MVFVWLPKSTVQAAVGGILLDLARKEPKLEPRLEEGKLMLTIAVAAIVLTAPIGAILISTYGESWLEKHSIKLGKKNTWKKSKKEI